MSCRPGISLVLASLAVLVSVFAAACDEPGVQDEEVVVPPAEVDPGFAVRGVRSWYLIDDATGVGRDVMAIAVDAPDSVAGLTARISGLGPLPLERRSNGEYAGERSLAGLAAGLHELVVVVDDETVARVPFMRSAPYYVVVTTDWDHADPGDAALAVQDGLHAAHPELRVTHFAGPYTFTDPELSAGRRRALVEWLVEQREAFGDEIGLHIHPYCHFVASAGLPCITDASTVYEEDSTGYTIKVSAYGREGVGALLDRAGELFAAHGLGRPRTFRAGGWTADRSTLAALADRGFIADSSALNWARIEEWDGSELYRWNREHWASIDDTSQPYRPNATDILGDAAPTLPILEVPDNGAMIDYVASAEMLDLFAANRGPDALVAPRTLVMGFHPNLEFVGAESDQVDDFLDYTDQYLAARDLGPVVYITLADLVSAYPP